MRGRGSRWGMLRSIFHSEEYKHLGCPVPQFALSCSPRSPSAQRSTCRTCRTQSVPKKLTTGVVGTWTKEETSDWILQNQRTKVRPAGRHTERVFIVSADILLSKGPGLFVQTYRLGPLCRGTGRHDSPACSLPGCPFLPLPTSGQGLLLVTIAAGH